MLDALGIAVLRLLRVAIGPLPLGQLAKGKVRSLTNDEKNALDRALISKITGAQRIGRKIRP